MHIKFQNILKNHPYVTPYKNTFVGKEITEIKMYRQNPDTFKKSCQKFFIEHKYPRTHKTIKIEVTQNPLEKGVIYKKIHNKKTGSIKKVPFTCDIAKSKSNWTTTYYFLEPKTKKEIGFVSISDWALMPKNPIFRKMQDSQLFRDFPRLGVIGDRITVDYLQNNNENLYSGIGKLADQIAVEYCLKRGIKPNIISAAEPNSLAAHYKRGKRFLPFDKECTYYERYKDIDPNELIKNLLKETKKIDTSDLHGFYTYMPKDLIKYYLLQIIQNPILK